MKPELHRVGESRQPVVTVDGATGDPAAVIAIAARLAPFPPSQTYYPGLRRIFTQADADAVAYAFRLLEAAAPFIGGAFDADGFDLLEASFSIVTAPPETLTPPQRAPHFDSTDPNYIAVLHYLADTPGTGTAFYRQRSTGIELVTEANRDAFVAAAKAESEGLAGYTNANNAHFEQIGRIDAVPDRLVIYRGALLHSGIIPHGMKLSADPRQGRLTANLFIRTH
ncbi:DUF6445 family protein [Sphingomonas sp. BT-65]|uniref:DUF6445 family protein n=1 Tax=Sphingomonas sp. BT-65 TaxID=2989821 RepID=UPI00223624B2|nr:DUF6445 family protein [Sphingomonas sp. BT-65]MCW4462283.1 DUF6445 family protein [Sphingomonas sp. BT-65]